MSRGEPARRALIATSGVARGALAAGRALAAAGWEVGVIASGRRTLPAFSRHVHFVHQAPPAGTAPEIFTGAVAEAVRRHAYRIVLPAGDAELLALSAHRERVDAELPSPPHQAVLRAHDKLELVRAAAAVGLVSPRTWRPEDPWPVSPQAPVMVKARLHREAAVGNAAGRHEAQRASGETAARARAEALAQQGARPIFQECITGPLMALETVLDPEGLPLALVQQRAVRVWPPTVGVTSYGVTEAVDPDLASGALRLLAHLDWSGLCQLQFILGPDGAPHLLDLNGRIYGSLGLAIAAGVNLPALWARSVAMPPAGPLHARVGVRYQWLEGDLRGALRTRERGALGRVLQAAPRATHSVFDAGDPVPTVAYAALALGRAVRRWRT